MVARTTASCYGFFAGLVTGVGAGTPRSRHVGTGCIFAFLYSSFDVGDVASLCPDERGGNSSIATAPSYLLSSIRANPCGSRYGIVPRLYFRCRSNCDNPCVVYRKLDFDCDPLEVRGWPSMPLAPQAQRSKTAK